MCLEIMHLKETESLHQILDNLPTEKAKITLTIQDNIKQLHICTDSRDVCFQLETEIHSTNYCAVANMSESRCEFVGLVGQKLRTRANEESFKHARDSLIKDAVQSRQQKLQVLSYQVEAASLFKSERSTNCKRALKRETKQRKPSPKRANAGTIDHPKEKVDHKMKNVSHVTHAPAATRTDQSQRGADLTALNTRSTNRKGRAKGLKASALSDESASDSYCTARRAEAFRRRRALELRLLEARKETDSAVREALVEAVRRDLYSLVDELRNDSRLVQAYPISTTS